MVAAVLIPLAFLLQAATAQTEIREWGSLGVGGGLALVMFYFYRQYRDSSEKQLKAVVDQQQTTLSQLMELIRENTEANTALRDAIHTVAACPFQTNHGANRVHQGAGDAL